MYSLGNLEASEIYSETKGFPGLDLSPDCRIVRFAAPLFYMNAERFKAGVFEQFDDKNDRHRKEDSADDLPAECRTVNPDIDERR